MCVHKQLSFFQNITWKEILDAWEKDEAHQVFWQEIYKQYPSWKKWRESCLSNDSLQYKDWMLYKINDPVAFANEVYCCPFNTWFKHYTEKNIPSKQERDNSYLGKIVMNSSLQNNPKICNILQEFPRESQILGITDGKRIMLYEGHHRCSALVLATMEKKIMNINLTIALCHYSVAEFEKIFYPTEG